MYTTFSNLLRQRKAYMMALKSITNKLPHTAMMIFFHHFDFCLLLMAAVELPAPGRGLVSAITAKMIRSQLFCSKKCFFKRILFFKSQTTINLILSWLKVRIVSYDVS